MWNLYYFSFQAIEFYIKIKVPHMNVERIELISFSCFIAFVQYSKYTFNTSVIFLSFLMRVPRISPFGMLKYDVGEKPNTVYVISLPNMVT